MNWNRPYWEITPSNLLASLIVAAIICAICKYIPDAPRVVKCRELGGVSFQSLCIKRDALIELEHGQ